MAPTLRIPVAVDLASFEQQAERGRQIASTAARRLAQEFLSANKEIATSAAGAAAAVSRDWLAAGVRIVATPIAVRAAWIAAAAGVVATIEGVVRSVRDQMQEVLNIA